MLSRRLKKLLSFGVRPNYAFKRIVRDEVSCAIMRHGPHGRFRPEADTEQNNDGGRMEVFYREHVFTFEPSTESPLKGRLRLDDQSRALLARLIESEEDDWYLDRDGERLPAEKLFLHTPWSLASPKGRVGLLCRFIDYRDGSVLFDALDTYLGEMHAFLSGRTGD
jgi:hypothetical protein